MTRFVDVPALQRIVKRVGVAGFISGMAAAIREDFCRWECFEKSARLASHSEIGVIELMPATDGDRYAFKYVNGHPSNAQKGMPTVMSFGVLAEVETGYPFLLSELTLTTAFRTASTSAVAAEVLARRDSRVMGMIGCGAQAEFQAIAFHTLIGIQELKIYDVDSAASQKLTRNLAEFPDLKITSVASASDAALADVVTTCTADKSRACILDLPMVHPGTHINGIGGDCPGKTELHADLLRNARIVVEYEPQTRVEGDIQQLAGDHPVHELWTVLTGKTAGRENSEQITVFDSVGFAIEDFAALRYVHQLAVEFDEGREIALVPDLNDPKDLYRSLIQSDAAAARTVR